MKSSNGLQCRGEKMATLASPSSLSSKVFSCLDNFFKKIVWHNQKYDFTTKVKTKAILEGDNVKPNMSLVCNLGSALRILKKIFE